MSGRKYIQLLPDIEEARIIRDALKLYIDMGTELPEATLDIAWKLLAEITDKTRKELRVAPKIL